MLLRMRKKEGSVGGARIYRPISLAFLLRGPLLGGRDLLASMDPVFSSLPFSTRSPPKHQERQEIAPPTAVHIKDVEWLRE
jgi:hypothetical protein